MLLLVLTIFYKISQIHAQYVHYCHGLILLGVMAPLTVIDSAGRVALQCIIEDIQTNISNIDTTQRALEQRGSFLDGDNSKF